MHDFTFRLWWFAWNQESMADLESKLLDLQAYDRLTQFDKH